MPVSVTLAEPRRSIDELADAVRRAKGDDPLRAVAVVVPTNQSGVMARRALGARGGVVGVDVVTLNRLAELLAGPALAEAGKRPVSTPVLDVAVRAVLAHRPGRFEAVADHPSTVVALRELHRELRLAGPAAVEVLESTWRGRDPARISRAVHGRLAADWYDEADLLDAATRLVGDGVPEALRRLIIHRPGRLDPLAAAFVAALGRSASIEIIVSEDGAPAELASLTPVMGSPPSPARAALPTPARVISATDADEEVRLAVAEVLAAARGVDGAAVPFERSAILWPSSRPYARLVEHHLGVAEIPWSGPSGTQVSERLVPRLLLDLLDLDRGGLRRRDLFDFLADIPARDSGGRPLRTSEWLRASRAAGVSRGDDWGPRLARLAGHERWAGTVEELSAFVRDLRTTLGPRSQRRTWWDWADWCEAQIESWLGARTFRILPDPEYRAWESLMGILERLRHLDPVAPPVTRPEFRAVMESEIDDASSRQGRVGSGLTIGPLQGSAGLDVDFAVVLGAADGVLPPLPRPDPLLADSDRVSAGLETSDHRAERIEARLRETMRSATTVVTVPRGDLRTTAERRPSRLLGQADTVVGVSSHAAGLAEHPFPAAPRDRRLGQLLRSVAAGRDLAVMVGEDPAAARALRLLEARRTPELTVYDGDLSGVGVPVLSGAVSATQLQAWAKCPHAYFMRYLLGVHHDEDPSREVTITSLERGSLQHEALDRFHRDVIDGRLPPPGTTGWGEDHAAALTLHAAEVCDEWEASGRTGRPATWRGERMRVIADLLAWLDADSDLVAARRAVPIASEWVFDADDGVEVPLQSGRALCFRGAIDRVDRRADGGLVVTDHKTGKADDFKRLDASDPTLGGTNFQLPTYAAAALALAANAGEPASGTVRAEYGMFRRGDYRRHGVEFTDDVWQAVRRELTSIVAGIEQGWFPQQPARPGWRLYVDCPYCEPDGLGTADAWSRWEAKRSDARIAEWFGEADDG